MSDNEGGFNDGLTDEDLSLPKATVQKIISELMPEEYSIAKDTRDLIADCCVEFIHLISSEANEISEKESKKTISGDHVISALKSLGYEDFIDEVNLTFVDHVKTEKERVKRKGQVKDSGLTPEEAERIQDEMFASAKARMEQGQSEPNSAVPE